MKKERIFYLDFVRAVATILIVMTHYNAIFLYMNPPRPEKSVITSSISKVYIGDVGVSLFLIISGAALMYVYDAKMDWMKFYKKRFLNIYPMFWIAYFGAFLYKFYVNRGINPDIPRYRIIYSVLGIDSYLSSWGQVNFAIVGEWFLGFIIGFYLIFPILRKWIEKSPISLGIVSLVLFVAFVIMKNPHNSILLPVLLPRLIFGMYFVKSGKKVSWKVALAAFGVIILNAVLPWNVESNIQSTYIGIAMFLVLVYVADFLKWFPFRRACSLICKYSYSIFIVHHIIILEMTAKMNMVEITKLYSYLLFLCCCCVIAGMAFFLQKVCDNVLVLFEKDNTVQETKVLK